VSLVYIVVCIVIIKRVLIVIYGRIHSSMYSSIGISACRSIDSRIHREVYGRVHISVYSSGM
jgi:hypothetical protein